MSNAIPNSPPVQLMPAVASFVYRDWTVTIREMEDDEPDTYFEWFLEKNGMHHRDPTTHRSIEAAEKYGKDAVDSIIQIENDRIRRRHKKK